MVSIVGVVLPLCGSLHGKLLMIAHRGASADAPENTLIAFNRAKAVGDFVEFDVRATKEGDLVVMHDSTVDRTTNGSGAVADLTLAQLRDLDTGAWFNKAFIGQRVLTADEAIAAIQTTAAPFMERKGGTIAQFVALLERQPLRAEGIVMSFEYGFVVALKRAKPDVHVGWVGSGALTGLQINQALADGVSHFVWAWADITPGMVDAIHRGGGLVFGWTVNDLGTTAALSDMGVDGVITDRSEDFAAAAPFASPLLGDRVQPQNRIVVRSGGGAVLAAAAPGRFTQTVEWRRAGDPTVRGRGARLRFSAVDSLGSGRYSANWVENGARVSCDYDVSIGGEDNHLVNISARMTIGTGEATGIVGFVVKSAEQPRFLLRAIGPSLASFGLAGSIVQPTLTLFRRGTVIDSDVAGSRMLASQVDFTRNGAFPLIPLSNDVAIMKSLEGDAYSVHLSCKTGQPGMGLVEVYQDNTVANWAVGAAVNLSLRGRARVDSPLIGGFVVPAGNSLTVMVRGIGPSFSDLRCKRTAS